MELQSHAVNSLMLELMRDSKIDRVFLIVRKCSIDNYRAELGHLALFFAGTITVSNLPFESLTRTWASIH